MNKRESPEINPQAYGHLNLKKEAKISNREMTISLKSSGGKTGQPPVKE